MLVLNVIPSSLGGGAEMIVSQIAKGIQSKDFQIEVVYFTTNNLNESFKHTSLGVTSRSPLAILKLRKLFKQKLKFDNELIVHAHLTWPLYYVALASIGLDVKLIYTEHSTHNKRRGMPFLKSIESLVYNRYSKIYCISDGVYRSLKYWLRPSMEGQLQVIPNGGRLFSFIERKNSLSETVKLISVGSLKSLKGFSVVIRALSLINKKKYKYTIVGEGAEYGRLQKLISDLNLRDSIKLVGWSDNIQRYFHDADIQLIPSKWEGFGLVAVEGMSTGLPVIASNVDGLNKVVEKKLNSVYLIDEYESPSNWAKAIEQMVLTLLTNRKELGLVSRTQAEKFSLDEMLMAYKNEYTNFLIFKSGVEEKIK